MGVVTSHPSQHLRSAPVVCVYTQPGWSVGFWLGGQCPLAARPTSHHSYHFTPTPTPHSENCFCMLSLFISGVTSHRQPWQCRGNGKAGLKVTRTMYQDRYQTAYTGIAQNHHPFTVRSECLPGGQNYRYATALYFFHPLFQGVSWPHLPLCADAHVRGHLRRSKA